VSAPRRGVWLGGHWVVDVHKQIDHWPEPETLAAVLRVGESNGGAAFNVACDLARLLPGVPLTGVGLVGDDGPGRWMLERCRQAGIGHAFLHRRAGVATSFTDVMTERESGRRTFFHLPGANALLAERDFPAAPEAGRIFYLGYLGLLETLDRLGADGRNGSSRLLERFSGAGFLSCADLVSAPNPDLAVQVAPCLRHLDVLFTNEWEAARLVGLPLAAGTRIAPADAASLAREILTAGVRRAVVLHFREGAVAALSGGDVLVQGAVEVPSGEVKGSAGAGDAFAAGFIAGWHEGLTPAECLEAAVCAAAASLGSITCSDAVRPLADCLAVGRQRGFRRLPAAGLA
jgi:sugar/nucleoside kinase (ribokinase family)